MKPRAVQRALETVISSSLLLGCIAVPANTPREEPVSVDIGNPDCEFLNPLQCLAPWPSSRYLVPDKSTATGFRVALPASAMPSSKSGVPVDPAPWNRWDGFSPTSSLLTVLPSPIDASALATWKQTAKSLEDASPTVLVDVATGARVAHFAELEESPESDAAHPTLYIRPAARLAENRLYAVGIRALASPGGKALSPARVFQVLRDKVDTRSPEIEARRDAFEKEVMGPLARAGVKRESLLEAWSFRTSSGKPAWGDLVDMRDDAFSGPEAGDFGCEVTSVKEDPADPQVFRSIEGTFNVPLYLTGADYGALLGRDAAGKIKRNGSTKAPFRAIVPRSVEQEGSKGKGPFRLVVYGHGLFSDRSEISRDFMVGFASKYSTVVIATDWSGLSSADMGFAASLLQDLPRFPELVDRVRQSHVNQLLLVRAAKGSCARLPAFTVNGKSVVDTKNVHYVGNSQGSSFGQTLAALTPDIERFGLGVGGISYPVMLPRSIHWASFGPVLESAYPSRADRDLLMVMFSHHWDLIEGAAFAPHLLKDPLPGSGKAKRILYQIGNNDAQTPDVAAHIAARTIGLPLFSPSAGAIPGLTPVRGEADSAVVIYDEGAPELPIGTLPPTADTPTHEAVRRDPRAQAQLDAFLRPDGVVKDFCGGPCAARVP